MADRPARERYDLKLPAIETKGGRWYTKYDPEIALDIVERIADGELLSKITAKEAVPLTVTKQTFLRWVSSVPELQKAYSGALQLSAHSFEEMAIDKAEKVAKLPGTPQNVSAASLLISQYRWSAARRNPTRYSDKGNTQIVVPVNINTTLNMGDAKQTMDVEVPDIYSISIAKPTDIVDGEFSEITDTSREDETNRGRLLGEGDSGTTEIKKEDFRALIRPDLPTVGTQRQPLLARTNKGGGVPGPRKRVLTPRIKKNVD